MSMNEIESDSDYVPHSPLYEPPRHQLIEDHPVEEAHKCPQMENSRDNEISARRDPTIDNEISHNLNSDRGESSRTVFSNIFTDSREGASNAFSVRPRTPRRGRGIPV